MLGGSNFTFQKYDSYCLISSRYTDLTTFETHTATGLGTAEAEGCIVSNFL